MKVSETVWNSLRQLRQTCVEQEGNSDAITLHNDAFRLCKTLDITPVELENCDLLITRRFSSVEGFDTFEVLSARLFVHFRTHVNQDIRSVYLHYLPIATSAWHSPGESFVIMHVAQSLDGKMCTDTGSSQWIGNEQNLTHAHRVRALVDAVAVGGNTAKREHPKLSVRHVVGDNPKRIIICNCIDGLVTEDLNNTYLICEQNACATLALKTQQAHNCEIIGAQPLHEQIDLNDCLSKLRDKGVYSIMVEGGPYTVGTLLQQGKVHWLQAHIAPLIFGEGRGYVCRHSLHNVDDAMTIRRPYYVQMGDAIMVSGQPQQEH